MREDAKGGKSRIRSRSGRIRWEHFDAGLFRAYGFSITAHMALVKAAEYDLSRIRYEADEAEEWVAVAPRELDSRSAYAPLRDYRALHQFVALASQPSADGVRTFIRDNGWLAVPRTCINPSTHVLWRGEPLEMWYEELRDLWVTVKLHNAYLAAGGDAPADVGPRFSRDDARYWLRSVIRGEERQSIRLLVPREAPYESMPIRHMPPEVVCDERVAPALLKRLSPSRPIEVARYLVHKRIQRKCRGQFSFDPYWNPVDPDRTELRVGVDSLLGMLYLQLATIWFREGKDLRECANPDCPQGRRFTPSRRDQKYCSSACKGRMAKLRRAAKVARGSD